MQLRVFSVEESGYFSMNGEWETETAATLSKCGSRYVCVM